jgi:hypothetical protein
MAGWMFCIEEKNNDPTKQSVLNRLLADRKDPSNRYYFEELFVIYFHICRCYIVAKKKPDFQKILVGLNVKSLQSQPN